MKFRAYLLIVMLGMAFLLTGCFVPENFKANVAVNNDGSYTFTYDGILAFAPALEAAKKGSLSQKDEAGLKQEAEKIRKQPDIKKVEYLGKGRYKVFAEKSGKYGEKYSFIKIFSVTPQEDGTIKITVAKLNKRDLNMLKVIGANVNGTLTVSVEKGVKVIKDNAQSKPKMFGLFGDYEWEIDSLENSPFIIVQPSSPNNVNTHGQQKEK